MIGYKAFNDDLTCRGFQYEIGGEYTMDGTIRPCERGFHFCETLKQTMCFYSFDPRTRWCEVEATDAVIPSDVFRKYATNHIKILREIPWETVIETVDITDQDAFVLVDAPEINYLSYQKLIPGMFSAVCNLILTYGYEKITEQIVRIHSKAKHIEPDSNEVVEVDIYLGLSADGGPVSCPKEFAWNFIKEHTEGK